MLKNFFYEMEFSPFFFKFQLEMKYFRIIIIKDFCQFLDEKFIFLYRFSKF